jgi:hypothetical protein
VGELDPPTIEYLRRANITIKFAGQLNVNKYHWNNFRFLFLDHLIQQGEIDFSKSPWVLLCDCRDVIFQANPFESFWLSFYKTGIHIALENCQVKNSRANLKWCLRTLGLWRTFKMRNTRVACAGTTIADPISMTRYISLMAQAIKSKPVIGKWSGMDQAFHNWILWNHQVSTTTHFYRNWQSPFLTLDSEHGRNKDSQGRWINGDGSVIPVIHQWDRV